MLGAGSRRFASRHGAKPQRERQGGDNGCQEAAERHHELIGSTKYRHGPFKNQRAVSAWKVDSAKVSAGHTIPTSSRRVVLLMHADVLVTLAACRIQET